MSYDADPLGVDSESLRGHFLVAGPRLRDRNFFKTVVLILEHTPAGAMGLIVNRPSSLSVTNALAGQTDHCTTDDNVFLGGPVEPDHLFLLHNNFTWQDASVEVSPAVYVTTDPQAFDAIVCSGKESEPRRVLSGYAGWAAGQLDDELQTGDWLVTDCSVPDVFSADPYVLWDQLRERINESHRLLPSNSPHPEWN